MFNDVKNWLKHIRPPDEIEITDFDAAIALVRATSKFNGHYSFAGSPLRAPIGKSAAACDLKLRVMLASRYRRVIPCPYRWRPCRSNPGGTLCATVVCRQRVTLLRVVDLNRVATVVASETKTTLAEHALRC